MIPKWNQKAREEEDSGNDGEIFNVDDDGIPSCIAANAGAIGVNRL